MSYVVGLSCRRENHTPLEDVSQARADGLCGLVNHEIYSCAKIADRNEKRGRAAHDSAKRLHSQAGLPAVIQRCRWADQPLAEARARPDLQSG